MAAYPSVEMSEAKARGYSDSPALRIRIVAIVATFFTFIGTVSAARAPKCLAHAEIMLWNIHSNEKRTFLSLRNSNSSLGWHGKIPSIAFSADARLFAIPVGENSAKIWDITSGNEICVLKNQDYSRQIQSMAFVPETKMLIAADRYHVKLYDLTSGNETVLFEHKCESVAFTLDGSLCAGTPYFLNKDGLLKILNCKTGLEQGFIRISNVEHLVFSNDRKQLATVSVDSQENSIVRIWNVRTNREIFRFSGHYPIAFSPDGSKIAARHKEGDRITLRDLKNESEAYILHGFSKLSALAFSSNGSELAAGGAFDEFEGRTGPRNEKVNAIKMWDMPSRSLIKTFNDPSLIVDTIGFSPDGKYLICAGCENTYYSQDDSAFSFIVLLVVFLIGVIIVVICWKYCAALRSSSCSEKPLP